MSICVNFVVVAMVTFVTVWGSGKALRGLDGSMDFAVDSMNAERTFIFLSFGVGVLSTLGCLLSAAWVLMEVEIASIATILIGWTMHLVCSEARRIRNVFHLPPEETVSFSELASVYPELGPSSRAGSYSSLHQPPPRSIDEYGCKPSTALRPSAQYSPAVGAPVELARAAVSPTPKGARDD